MKKTLFLAAILGATLGFSNVSWADDPEYTPLELRNGQVRTVVLGDEHMHISYLDVASIDEHYGKPYLNSQNQIVMNLDDLDGYKPEEDAKDFYRLHLEGFPLILPDGSHSYIKSYMGGNCVISFGHGTSLEGMVEQVDDRDGVKERYSWLTNDIEVREFCSASMSGGYYGGTITMKKAASLTFDMDVIPANVDYEKPNGGAAIIMTGGTPTTPDAIGSASILDMAGRVAAFDLSVSGDWNILTNGTFAGKATITGGELTLNTVTIESNVTFTMGNGARLDLGDKAAWLGGFNFFGGTATVDNGTLWLENETATLNTNLSGTYELELRGATLDLNRSVFDNKVIVAGESTITNGEIDNTITILGATGGREGAKLTLGTVSTRDNVSFIMGNGATLDLGSKAQEMSSFELEDSATAYVNNGYLFVDRNETVTLNPNLIGDYKLNMRGGVLKMGDNDFSKKIVVMWDSTLSNGSIGAAGTEVPVAIYSSTKLTLQDVEVGDGVAFTMSNNAVLDLGGAQARLAGFTLEEGTNTATVVNGTLWVKNETASLNPKLTGSYGLELRGGATLDLENKQTALNLTAKGEGNTIAKGGTFAGTAVITEGSLALPVDVDNNAVVIMQGNATLDLGGGEHSWTPAYGLTVQGTGNTLKNGYFIGTLVMEGNSYLYSDSAMASWNGPASIVMNNGSTLEMATGTGKDRWINDVSKLKVNGTATVVNAYLRIKPGDTYTLGNGVENLVGEGRSFLSLDNSTLDLGGGEISKLDIGVWAAFAPYNNVIKNGKINSYVEIDPSGKLSLNNVTIGDNASFAMRNNTQLDLGGASAKLGKITLAESATATVNNGSLWLGDGETATLNPNLVGSFVLDLRGCTLNLGDNTLTRDTTVTGDAIIGGGSIGADVYIDSSRKLKLDHVAIGDTATFTMGDGALLNLGEALAGLSKFKFTGETATIDNGTLFVGEGESAKLDADLSGTSLLVLYDGATLDLNDKTLTLDTLVTGNGNIITPGRFEMNITIADGQLKLSADMTPEASVLLAGNATLDVQKDVSVYDLFVSGTGNKVTGVEDTDTATFAMENEAQLDLDNEKVGLDKFTFGKGTSVTIDNGTLSVTEGTTFTLDANISGTGSKISLETDSRLNVGDFGLLIGCGVSGDGTIVKEMSSTASVSGSMQDFSGSVEVQAGTLNIMNVDEDAGLNVADVTIAADGVLGVYKGSTVAETSEGTLTVTGGHKLTAGVDARLNADLVMGGGVEAPAVLDVSANLGDGGLDMGSTVTLNPGSVLLSDADMKAIGALDFMGKYDLFNGVDGLSLGGDFLSELGLADKWVKAADVFANPELSAEKDYYLFYSGVNRGGVGGNVGTVYLMQIPEPTTGTLSLLALCALAARRRKH